MQTKTTPLSATVALMAGIASSASAALVAFADLNIPIPTTYDGVSLDLETGLSTNALDGALGADLNFALGGVGLSNDGDKDAATPSWQPVRVGTGNTDVIEDLGVGTVVGPTSVVSTGFGGSVNHFGPFVSGQRGYIGFSLVLDDGNDTVAYGWMDVTLQNDNTPGMIHSWFYDDSGDPVEIVAIPEPSHTFLIAVGFGCSVLRRRR